MDEYHVSVGRASPYTAHNMQRSPEIVGVKDEPVEELSRLECGKDELEEEESEDPVHAMLEPEVVVTETVIEPKPIKVDQILSVSEEELSKITGVQFSKKGFLVQTVKGLTCLICELNLSSRSCLFRHLQLHLPRSRIVCNVCHRQFASIASLKQHQYLHTDFFKCDICGKKTNSNSDLKKHKESHATEKKFQCDICNKFLLTSNILKAHKFLHTDMYKCDVCNRRCLSKFALKTHKETHFPHFRYPCSVCKKTFSTKNVLNLHKNVHTGRFQCNICNQCCITRHALEDHMTTHSSVRSFECGTCGKTFRCKSNLRIHIRRHIRGYKCTECGTVFVTRMLLKAHSCKVKTVIKNLRDSTYAPVN